MLTVFRRDELLTLPLRVDAGPPQRWRCAPRRTPREQQQAVLAHWLRTVVPDEAVQDPGLPPPPGWEPPRGAPRRPGLTPAPETYRFSLLQPRSGAGGDRGSGRGAAR